METNQAPAPKKKPFYKKVWFWVIAIIVLLIIIGSGSNTPTKVGSNASSSTDTSNQPQTATTYKVGDNIKLGDSILTVNSVSISHGADYMTPSAGNEWIDLNVTIQNTASTQQNVTTLGQMFLKDAGGNSYQIAVTDKQLSNPSNSLDGTIIANSKRTGWVGFEVPQGDKGLQFQYNGSMFGGDGSIVVDLGK